MSRLFPVIWIFAWGLSAAAQPYLVRGTIQQAGDETVYLASYFEDRFRIIDSTRAVSGTFQFILSDQDPAGVYRLVFSEVVGEVHMENLFVEFIFNMEDLVIQVTPGEHGPLPYFDQSAENQVYSDFVRHQMEYEAEMMETFRVLYPPRPGHPVYEAAVAYHEALQQERMRYIDSVSVHHPDLYATRIINAFRTPIIPGNLTREERIDTLKKVFFSMAPIRDPLLLHAPVYTFRIVDFLALFRSSALDREAQEQAFKEAADQIMANVTGDEQLRQFVAEFLYEGFELLEMHQVIDHLAMHYLDAACVSDLAEMVRERTESYRLLTEGMTAPDFVVRDTRGRNVVLSEIGNPYILVVFWATTCPHCRTVLPDLHAWYANENKLDVEVVAVSIDSSRHQYDQYLAGQPMTWINAWEPLGWMGKVASDYHIYETPSMILLDGQRRILDKPGNFRQFRRYLSGLED